MGIRQEHGKVLKLQVVQTLYGMLSYNERVKHEASFESAYRGILGEAWDNSGLSMESADGLAHYLRGIHSAKGTPLRVKPHAVVRRMAHNVLSLESKLESFQTGDLAAAMMQTSMESEAVDMLKRYGLDTLSVEGKFLDNMKLVGGILKGLLLGPGKKTNEKPEEPFDPKKVDWSNVHKMAKYIEDASFPFKEGEEHTQKPGKISGEGIVRNLTWGNQFDEKDPVGFIKKKFAEWDKFYHQHEAAVEKMSNAVRADEKTTRPAVMAVKDDEDKMDEILEAACQKLLAMDNPTKLAERLKPVWPGALEYATYKRAGEYNMADALVAKNLKEPKEIRALTQAEARELLNWLKERVMEMKKYMTIFDKARWSDHSDGDPFWDATEQCSWVDEYAGLIYWQSCDQDFIDNMPQIDDILVKLSNGIMNWVDRSFTTSTASE